MIIIKGDDTEITGRKIIRTLESLGGYNINEYSGHGSQYYYIDENNYIEWDTFNAISSKYSIDEITIYNSLQEYLNSLNHIINYNDI